MDGIVAESWNYAKFILKIGPNEGVKGKLAVGMGGLVKKRGGVGYRIWVAFWEATGRPVG